MIAIKFGAHLLLAKNRPVKVSPLSLIGRRMYNFLKMQITCMGHLSNWSFSEKNK